MSCMMKTRSNQPLNNTAMRATASLHIRTRRSSAHSLRLHRRPLLVIHQLAALAPLKKRQTMDWTRTRRSLTCPGEPLTGKLMRPNLVISRRARLSRVILRVRRSTTQSLVCKTISSKTLTKIRSRGSRCIRKDTSLTWQKRQRRGRRCLPCRLSLRKRPSIRSTKSHIRRIRLTCPMTQPLLVKLNNFVAWLTIATSNKLLLILLKSLQKLLYPKLSLKLMLKPNQSTTCASSQMLI